MGDRKRSCRRSVHRCLALVAICAGPVGGCSPNDIVGTVQLPSNINDPAAMQTPAGAVQSYNGALATFRAAFGGDDGSSDVQITGLLADELHAAGASNEFSIDARQLPDGGDSPAGHLFGLLQAVRAQAAQARGLLRDFAPNASPALRGHLYALEGYADVMLAELYCSGIPLSTVNYGGDYTLAAGSSTTAVLDRAVTLFDTALTLSSDSARFLYLARVGEGRALLDLGRFADAAAAVQDVPTGFSYDVSYSGATDINDAANFAKHLPGEYKFAVSDLEGTNGLPFQSSGDPRTAVQPVGQSPDGAETIYYPVKYAMDGGSPIVLADWTEARLIEAEAALQVHDYSTWLGTLNLLRETAITPALPDTTDPGVGATDADGWDARVDLMFRERGFWLFLTGHRQGDLRRLIRQYGRFAERVYPTGGYDATTSYGTAVNAPIPTAERAANPLFHGCIDRGA